MKYGTILSDPPWRFATWSDKGRGRSPDGWKNGQGNNVARAGVPRHYDTMPLTDIMAMPVDEAAADDCVLFMWATKPMLPAAIDVGLAWGFEYKTIAFTWVKRTKTGKAHFGMGHWTRANPEPCLLFTRGAPKRLSRSVRELIEAPVREHSRKPDEIYARIEALVAGPYLEMFSRTTWPGWDQWGDQAGRWLAPRMIGDAERVPVLPGQMALL